MVSSSWLRVQQVLKVILMVHHKVVEKDATLVTTLNCQGKLVLMEIKVIGTGAGTGAQSLTGQVNIRMHLVDLVGAQAVYFLVLNLVD